MPPTLEIKIIIIKKIQFLWKPLSSGITWWLYPRLACDELPAVNKRLLCVMRLLSGKCSRTKNISVLSKNISLLRSLCTLALYYYYYYLLFCCYKGIGLALLRRLFFVSFCCSKWNSQWQGRHKIRRKRKIIKKMLEESMGECFTGKRKKKCHREANTDKQQMRRK